MASALDLAFYGMRNRSAITPAAGFGMMVADTAVGFGGSVALGELYVRYHDKWYGKYMPEIVGGVGKVLEGILIATQGVGWLSGIAGSLGQVGVNAAGLDLGMEHARKKLGVKVAVTPAAVPAAPKVGALPAGRGLAWDQVSELAAMH
jgi:hypothetical protein